MFGVYFLLHSTFLVNISTLLRIWSTSVLLMCLSRLTPKGYWTQNIFLQVSSSSNSTSPSFFWVCSSNAPISVNHQLPACHSMLRTFPWVLIFFSEPWPHVYQHSLKFTMWPRLALNPHLPVSISWGWVTMPKGQSHRLSPHIGYSCLPDTYHPKGSTDFCPIVSVVWTHLCICTKHNVYRVCNVP